VNVPCVGMKSTRQAVGSYTLPIKQKGNGTPRMPQEASSGAVNQRR
jgi:hypothetical protein